VNSGEPLLIYNQPASRRQLWLIGLVALLLMAAPIVTFPFERVPLARIDAFIPVVDALLLFGDVLTATLLFAHAAVFRSRALLALATGYLFTGLIIIPHALTFPFAFSPTGLLGAGVGTTVWLYFFWHAGLPLAVTAYARLKNTDAVSPIPYRSVRGAIVLSIVGSVLVAAALTLLATVGEPLLPVLFTDAITWQPSRVVYVVVVMLALLLTAMIAVSAGQRSILDWWLLLVMWAWFVELLLILTTNTRFSVGWYVGRSAGLLSGVFVLLMLLAETNRLYARLALSVTAEQRERESRLLTMNAVAASIAHEVKQPLAAIVVNAQAGAALLKETPTNTAEVAGILQSIAQQGLDAAQVVDSIRGIFAKRPSEKAPLNINELLRETATLVADELSGSRISLQLELHEPLLPVTADRLRLQHVFLNLFVNAIEAMRVVSDRPHTLSVRSTLLDTEAVVILVEDSGVGLPADHDRIFDAFFTTKASGTGMGLALSRSIVDAHGGRLWAAAHHPHGSTFHVQLPLT